MTEALLALLRAIDPRVGVHDGTVPTGATGPAVALYGAAGAPTARRVDGQAHQDIHTWRAVCSSNTPAGARAIATQVIATVDGTRLLDALLQITHVGPLIEDRDDPADYRWSITAEIVHLQPRSRQ